MLKKNTNTGKGCNTTEVGYKMNNTEYQYYY